MLFSFFPLQFGIRLVEVMPRKKRGNGFTRPRKDHSRAEKAQGKAF